MPEVLFYYALDRDGHLVSKDVADKDTNGPFTCPHCRREMVARNVKRQRQRARHFAHKHVDDRVPPAECYDHGEHLGLQKSICDAFAKHVLDRTPYLVRYRCGTCASLIDVDLTSLGRAMETEAAFQGLRPDLLIRDAAGEVRAVIEIVVEHALSKENAARYLDVGIPVFVVYDSIPEQLGPTSTQHAHTREVVSDWVPAAIMSDKRSHPCDLRASASDIAVPSSSEPVHVDNCTLSLIASASLDVATPTSGRSPTNPRQVRLRPPNLRTMEGGRVAPVDPLFALRLAETLCDEIPGMALEETLCPVHNVQRQDFTVDVSLRRCPACNADARIMTLSPWYFETPDVVGELGQFPRRFSRPRQEAFVETAVRWGVLLKWFPRDVPTGGVLTSCCPSCSDAFHWFGTWPYAEPYEFLVDRRRFYWCPICNEYRLSSHLDDVGEKQKNRLRG